MERIRGWLPALPAVVLALTIGVAVGMPDRPADSVLDLTGSGVPDVTISVITVHISGEVVRPGLVTVDDGARLVDAVVAAGGATLQADLTSVNLAQRIADGQHLLIPARGEPGAPAPDGSIEGRIAVNRATAEELQALPGVGPVLAGRIVAHREANGHFETVEDLLDVSGIGERTLATFRDLIVVP